MSELKFPSATTIEGLPWWVRGLLGCAAACLAAGLTYSILPLRSFPLLFAFPAVILSCWFFGMWGGVSCAFTDAILVDSYFTLPQLRFTLGSAPQEVRLTVFLTITITLGYTLRRLSLQRALLSNRDLQQRLILANAQRQLAEERARVSEALRDREDVLQIALHANGMALWVRDLQTGTLYWSDEKYRMIGFEPGSIEPTTETWLRFVHPDDVDEVKKSVARVFEGVSDYHNQYRVVRPDGAVRWLESRAKCQQDSEGRPARVVGVVSDVTRRKLADEGMLRAEKLAVVGRLAASVAHEINNPLEAVANLLFLITLADTTEMAQAQARQALDELMRVSLITQQTLRFHRQMGALKAARLSELVEAVLALFRGKLMAAQIAVELRVEREKSVACMPGEAQQIFANLVSNAIEAMPQGGQLIVRLRPSRDWRQRDQFGMRVTFCDSGVGMDRATMRRIFEPFFTTKTDTGTGLGMWVVGQLLERHHGQIRVWSWQRKGASGTAFSVFLPFETTVPIAEETKEFAQNAS